MGIDIRDGPQLECIQCALCIDACDEIMEKVGRPPKLIAYDTFRNLDAASHGARAPLRIIRPRTLLYAGALMLAVLIMMLALSAKTTLDVNVQADRNPLFVTLSDGGIRNSYNVRILNKQYETRFFTLELRGLRHARLALLGMEGEATPRIEVAPDNLRTLKAFVTVPREAAGAMSSQAPFEIVVRDLSDGTQTSRETVFRGPDK
jgi:polyferredoxin